MCVSVCDREVEKTSLRRASVRATLLLDNIINNNIMLPAAAIIVQVSEIGGSRNAILLQCT